MKVEDIVEFKKTKNRYRIAGFGRMKNPSNGKWVDSVIYEAISEYKEDYGYIPTERGVYIREKSDFEEKFEQSVPAVQIMDSRTGQFIYDFGVPEFLLAKYFDLGYAGSVNYKPESGIEADKFCYNLAFNILVCDQEKADEKIPQELLDEIRGDIKAGKFKKTPEGVSELQSLLFFLSIKSPETQGVEPPAVDGEGATKAPEEEDGDQE